MLSVKNEKHRFGFIILCIFLFNMSIISLFAQLKISGYIQSTMIKTESNKAFVFGFDRVRTRLTGQLSEIVGYKVQVDFTKSATDVGNDGSTPAVINYAEIIYKLTSNIQISAGKFKTPVGMEWNTGPPLLDFVKRGLGQAFVYHFDAGAMITGNEIGKPGFGFAAGLFNYGPNKANNVGDPSKGHDYTLTGRLSVDPTNSLHVETYFGSALTSVEGQKNVNVYGGGVKFKPFSQLQLKGEYISRSDEQNNSSDGNVFYIQAGYLVHPKFEPVVKYEKLDVSNNANDQKNITIGLNIFLNPKVQKQSKIMINYVSSDLDGKDAVQVMYQVVY